jgi:hypothetical protein
MGNKEVKLMLAVLIDADNVQPSAAPALMSEIALIGNASVRRIYGDWTTPSLSGWKNVDSQPFHPACSAIPLHGR